VVSLGNRVLHVVGPFGKESEAESEGRLVGQGVEMFRPLDADDEGVSVRVLPLVANLSAMIPPR
jgi:hypothetical protein